MFKKIGLLCIVILLLLPMPIQRASAAGDDNVNIAAIHFGPASANFSNALSDYDLYLDRSSTQNYYFGVRTEDSRASRDYRVNGGGWIALPDWTSTGYFPINPGTTNLIEIRVTSFDTTASRIVTLHVHSPLPSDPYLRRLETSEGALSPTFNTTTYTYTLTVPYTTNSLKLTPTLNDADGKVDVDGVQTVSGTASAPINLSVGSNPIALDTTSADNNQSLRYTVNIIREALSAEARLSNLSLSAGSLSPNFDSAIIVYDTEVPSSVQSLTVKPTLADNNASLTLQTGNGNDVPLTNDTHSLPILLQEGQTLIRIKVTAQDGSEKIYTLRVFRPSSNADLSQLSVNPAELSPLFDSSTVNYEATVEYTVSQLTLKPVASESHATIAVSVNDAVYANVLSDTYSQPLPLIIGENRIRIKVNAQSGAEQTYSLKIFRLAPPQQPSATYSPTPTSPGNIAVKTPVPSEPIKPLELTDITGYWAEPLIRSAVSQGWISGYPDGTFLPKKAITRQEFAVVLTQALGLAESPATNRMDFSDAQEIAPYALNAMSLAYQRGLFLGYPDGSIRPNANINRMEMILIVMRELGKLPDEALTTGFADDDRIPAWAKPSVRTARQWGLVRGHGDNRLAPTDTATRAEAVAIVQQLLVMKSSQQ